MNNKQALTWAIDEGAFNVKQFSQHNKSEPWCIAFSATWIRRRARGKELFDDKAMFAKPTKNQHLTKWKAQQAGEYHGRYVNKDNTITTKFATMQTMFKGGTTREEQYIAHGGFKYMHQADKEGNFDAAKLKKPLLQKGTKVDKVEIGANGEGFIQVLGVVSKNKCLASIGYGSLGIGTHALALDCQPGACVFFDSMVGELSFPDIGNLCRWWEKCYADRASQLGKLSAWGGIKAEESVWATLYLPVDP